MKKHVKFVIVSARPDSGGTIVLHTLYKCLSLLEYDTKIFYVGNFRSGKTITRKIYFWVRMFLFFFKDLFLQALCAIDKTDRRIFDGYRNPTYRHCKRKILPFVSKNTIVVYPEVIYGNPLHACNSVRWFLYYNRYKDDTMAYGKSDFFVCYRQKFNDDKLNPQKVEFYINYFDLDLYRRYNYDYREGNCYIIRKGKNRDDLPTVFDGIIVDNLSEKRKVEIFNQCEYCISYDTQTAYSSIASMCGCISVIIPEQGKNRHDYLSEHENGFGCAYGFDVKEIQFAKETAEEIRKNFQRINNVAIMRTEQFAKKCISFFNLEAEK